MSVQIFNEDCLTGMDRIEDGSVSLILADVPYAVTQNGWDSLIPFEPLWSHYRRIIKPNGAIVLTATQPFTGKLAASNLEWLRYEWVWVKSCPTGYLNAHKRPMPQHENILVFSPGQPAYYPQGLQPYDQMKKRGRPTTNYGTHQRENYQEFTNYPRSVLHFPYDEQKLHPTQKPVALFEYLVRTHSQPGEFVLDNCMGSGTTGVAAVRSGRDFIGFELDVDFFNIAQKRISDEKRPDQRANLDWLFEEDAA
jgi:site-specific DNA-methyltransferase (adenine-specific)